MRQAAPSTGFLPSVSALTPEDPRLLPLLLNTPLLCLRETLGTAQTRVRSWISGASVTSGPRWRVEGPTGEISSAVISEIQSPRLSGRTFFTGNTLLFSRKKWPQLPSPRPQHLSSPQETTKPVLTELPAGRDLPVGGTAPQ